MSPVCLPIGGSRRHSASSKRCVSSNEITLVESLLEIRKTVQEFWLGRGKVLLKKVSNSSSDLKCHSGLLPNDRDGISVMEL